MLTKKTTNNTNLSGFLWLAWFGRLLGLGFLSFLVPVILLGSRQCRPLRRIKHSLNTAIILQACVLLSSKLKHLHVCFFTKDLGG
jgi:hypothetical protein